MHNVGIPTTYRGRVYRSQLEARWAAFFDLLGWPFEYEPFALAGWIPDFVLYGQKGEHPHEILIEIKPTMDVQAFPVEKIVQAIQQSYVPKNHDAIFLQSLALFKTWRDSPGYPANRPKILNRNDPECLLLGSTIRMTEGIYVSDFEDCVPQLGWLLSYFWDGTAPASLSDISQGIDQAVFAGAEGQYDFHGTFGDTIFRITGHAPGARGYQLPAFDPIQVLWNQAGNEVQWRKPRKVNN